ncbi:DUF2157 domain-containing protein [Moraxella marmotae]|uniref:DUF2157 domain-containing protein n=1 Tax=Moraxella marmotae TaxID=3344520 RepID=UPI0035F3A1C3
MSLTDFWQASNTVHQPKPSNTPTHIAQALVSPPMLAAFGVIGAALMASSVVYLLAANWLLLPDAVKLSIAPLLMLAAAMISLRTTGLWQSVLHTICGLMIGLGLLVIGQVYQTGADNFWLFAIWSLLLVPWLYRDNQGVYLLLAVVAQLALWLYFDQRFMQMPEWQLGLSLLLVIGQYVLFGRSQLALWLTTLAMIGLSFFASMTFDDMTTLLGRGVGAVVILSPLLMAAYARQQPKIAAVALAGVASSLFTLWVVLTPWLDTSDWLMMAAVAQLWFGLCAWLLFWLFGKRLNHQYSLHTPILAVGGWVSSLFAIFGVQAWVHDAWQALLACGMVSAAAGVWLFWYSRQQSAYFRHLAYALVLIGTGLVGQGLARWLDNDGIGAFVLVQYLLLVLLYRLRVHWFYLLVHLLIGYGAAVFYAVVLDDWSVLHWAWGGYLSSIYGLGLMASLLLYRQHSRCQHLGCDRTVAGFVLSMATGFGVVNLIPELGTPPFWASLGLLLGLGFGILAYLPLRVAMLLSLLGVLFGVGHAPIVAVILVFAHALSKHDRMMVVLSSLVGIGLLWLLYYQLSVPFLLKFITIFISGLVVFVMAKLLSLTSFHQAKQTQGASDA